MKLNKVTAIVVALLLLAGLSGYVVSSRTRQQSPDAGETKQSPVDGSMSVPATEHQHAGAHMKVTAPRRVAASDQQRADAVADAARQAVQRYQDYRAALRDGYRILAPGVPQSMYHFNNFAHAAESDSRFNPARPTSLLYEKVGEGYRLIGVMYTAPATMSEDELDARIPLSVARWHKHVNICLPPGMGWEDGIFAEDRRFGLEGSIETRETCQQAGGRFVPELFGWMVHLYPFEPQGRGMWSLDRQLTGGSHHQH